MKRILAVALLAVVCGSCAKQKSIARLEPEKAFEQAKKEYTLKHYDKAIEKFRTVIFESPAGNWTEESQYLLARSSYLKKNYVQAETEYDFFINTYPNSRFMQQAEYELAVCYFKHSPPFYLEQTATIKAMQELDKFIAKYPDSEYKSKIEKNKKRCIDKLVKKDLQTAKLYLKIGKTKSANIYLKSIQENYPENSYSKEVAMLITKCSK
ncbi:MAG: outer membrane protein assembly factor BamD [bacterium]|nr:outer membrane protein assembly factor BamD [bacterium]